MDIGGIREALHKQPFQPFTMRLTDGRSVEIRHPDFVALGTRRIVVIKPDDSTMMVEPLLIVSLDTTAPIVNSKTDGNGQAAD